MFVAKQHSAFSRFVYDLFDCRNNLIGSLNWPDIAVATNARLKNLLPAILNSKIGIKYQDKHYEIVFEYLSRDWFNNIRFMLACEGTVLASADVVGSKKFFKQSEIIITAPFTGSVIRKSSMFTTRYEVLKDGVTIGTVAEKGGLTLKRELSIDLPDSIIGPVQTFIFFLVHNHAYR